MNTFVTKTAVLGEPLPDSLHAVSVSLPHWADVVGYEEREDRVLNALKTAYPRFCYHPSLKQLFANCEQRFAADNEFCLVFPSQRSAERCLYYIQKKEGKEGRIHALESHDLYAVTLPEQVRERAKEFWQHVGLNPSSRQAEAVLEGRNDTKADKEKHIIRERLSSLTGHDASDVYLFPSGMSAVFTIHQMALAHTPDAKTIQLGFPYVDSLKIQEKCGLGVRFVNYTDPSDLDKVAKILKQERIAAVFCEVPSNPLLNTIDIKALSILLKENNVPLIVDDTLSTWENIDFRPYADAVVTSLTKFFSGVGDVMAGALTLNNQSPFYADFKQNINERYEDLLFSDDAVVLEKNSRDCAKRMQRINQTAEKLCDVLKEHPVIQAVYYPKYINTDTYDALKKENGGYGGLFSVVLKDSTKAPAFYDALSIAKGPSLGTDFTLACPYTLLAHYHELEFVESCGVSSYLIRVSVGLEDAEELIKAFESALTQIA